MQNEIKDIVTLLKLQDEIREKYLVEDLLGNNIKILLILESPHIDEILCKYPVAGDTGIEISKSILDNIDKPIGKYIKDNLDSSIFGIMNCCQIPMQESPYCYQLMNQELLNSFKTIRNTKVNVKKRNDKYIRDIDNEIYKNLRNRLTYILEKSDIKLIIPCGRMANYFVNKCSNLTENIKICNNIPHPARNNWSGNKRIKILKQFIERTIK